MEPARAAFVNFKPTKMQGMCFMWKCEPRQDAAEVTIAKTNFWVPHLYAALKRRLGQAVVLDPAIVSVDAHGRLLLNSTLETGISDRRVLFMAYNYPLKYALGPQGPNSMGYWVAPFATTITSAAMPSDTADWHSLSAYLSKPFPRKLKMAKVKGGTWKTLINSAEPANSGEPIEALAETLAAEAKQAPHDPTAQARTYSRLLGLSESEANLAIGAKLLAAETRFRLQQSEKLSRFLRESEYGQSLRKMAVAEADQLDKQQAAGFAMLAGGVGSMAAGLGASGAAASQISMNSNIATLKGLQKMAQTQDVQQNALRQALEVQVELGSDVLGSAASITAASVDELRQRFKVMLARRRPT